MAFKSPPIFRWFVQLLFAALIATAPLNVSAGQYSAHQIQALYLFNFASFIRWPAVAFESESSPFVYCVLGKSNQVATTLSALIKGERVGSREMKVRVVESLDDIGQCQVLMAVGEQSDQRSIALVHSYVLTVSDSKGFAGQGGMLELMQLGKRIKPIINIDQLNLVKLKASSKLLRFSKQVHN